MTDSEPGDKSDETASGGAARGHRRGAARQKAQLARQRRKRRARGRRWAIQGGIAVVVLAIAAVVIFGVVNSAGPSGPGPANMASDGIAIGKGFTAVKTDALAPSEEPSSATTTAASDKVDIVVYVDYLCPICGQFEKANDDYIAGLVRSGAATVEYHPIAILTNQSLGTKYSQRAANAGACVANFSPDSYFGFNTAMFRRQPAEGTSGLSDAQLVSLIKGVDGVGNVSRISRCVTKQSYKSWVLDSTERALTGPLGNGTSVKKVTETPTILVNGLQYDYSTPFTSAEFSNFVVTAAGNSYAGKATPTATPKSSPAPTSSPTPKATSSK